MNHRQHQQLSPGTRVRSHGQRWPLAYRNGTAIIVRATRQWRDSTWEYDVCTDDGRLASWNWVHPAEGWE